MNDSILHHIERAHHHIQKAQDLVDKGAAEDNHRYKRSWLFVRKVYKTQTMLIQLLKTEVRRGDRVR